MTAAREALANLIAEERDKYPRRADDMDSEELADAILSAFPGIRKTIEGETWEYGWARVESPNVLLYRHPASNAVRPEGNGWTEKRRRPASPWEVCDE